MEIFKLVGFSIFAVFLILIVKETRKDIALAISIFAGIALIVFSLTKLEVVINLLNDLVSKSGINKEFFEIILKVTAIAYIIEFGKNICIDAGQTAIATKLEMAGKIIITVLSIPLITSLLNSLNSIL